MTHLRPQTYLARLGAAALALVAGSAGTLAAQQTRPLFAWNGRVDREVLLVMRGRNVDTRANSRDDYGRLRVGSRLPQREGVVRLRVERGRGSADVVQQPSARNSYTAVVRLRDDQSGAGDYQVAAYWQPVNGTYAGDYGDYDGDGDYDRDDRRGNNGQGGGWGRGGRRDDDRDRDRRNGDRDRDDHAGRTTGGTWGGVFRRGSDNAGSGVLRWSGRVDDVQEIRIRGRRADTYAVSGDGAAGVRSSVSGTLPAREVTVRLRQNDGRGRVRVVEQPSARNNYTAVVRVEDRDGGAGYYDFEASW